MWLCAAPPFLGSLSLLPWDGKEEASGTLPSCPKKRASLMNFRRPKYEGEGRTGIHSCSRQTEPLLASEGGFCTEIE